jgi:hypothetical protein
MLTRWIISTLLTLGFSSAAYSQQTRGTRLWNLTRYTITNLQMSPAGANVWGANQCANDKDGEVDHDERLRITGITTGKYDIKFRDKSGRVCFVRDTEVKDGSIFTIEEKQLADCAN